MVEPEHKSGFDEAMQELRRKVRALHDVFPASNKAEKAIERTEKEWQDRLKEEPDRAKAGRLHEELEKNSRLLREELSKSRRADKESEREL